MPLSQQQKATVAESKKAAKQRREVFAAEHSRLVGRSLPTDPLVGVGRLPAWAVWTHDSASVTAAVPARESGPTIDKALAYGLFHAGDRDLHLVVPAGEETPTLVRAAFLTASITVWTHHDGTLEPCKPLSRDQAQAHLTEMTGLRVGEHQLDPDERWVHDLVTHAEENPSLSPAHRGSYLAWHAYGMQVLRLHRSKTGIHVIAGINYTRPGKPGPLKLTIAEPLKAPQLEAILGAMQGGIAAAQAREAGPYREHLLQENLTRQRNKVGWGDPDALVREFPALRPRGSGFIDFIRFTQDSKLHLVETKIGLDPFVVLQGLDYWIWSRANATLLERHLGAAISSTQVDYVLGDEDASAPTPTPVLSKYAASHLPLLPAEMRWQLAKAAPIDSGHIRLESLPTQALPPQSWVA